MTRLLSIIMLLIAGLTISGCKIVFDEDKDSAAIPEGPDGDGARNQARIDDTFESQLVPLITGKALPVDRLQTEIAKDIVAAGAEHANQGSGQGSAWNFSVSGHGKVLEANLESRARTVSVDVNSDGNADVTVQLGPVVRGTALRDVAPFYDFDDFRDQIEYANLARALNDKVTSGLIVPDTDVVGKTVDFTGVTPLKSANDPLVVTPINVRFSE